MIRMPMLCAILPLVLLLVPPGPGAAADPVPGEIRLDFDPETIEVDLFFSGAVVTMEGTVPAGLDVVFVCSGKPETLELKRKGKRWGVLWMNVGDVTFEQVPSVYLFASSRQLDELASPETMRQLGIGYQALPARADPDGQDTAAFPLFDELVKLKESAALFWTGEGVVRLEPSGEGKTRARLDCPFPAKVPTGEYEVRLFGFSRGEGRLLASGKLEVRQVGVAAFISSLAHHNGLLYGILSVVLALAAGLLTGFVFSSGSKGGH